MLAIYMLTVMAGLAIHLFGTLPLIFFLASRKNPYKFMKGLTQAAATALGRFLWLLFVILNQH
jgi:Na+/H+-dicarboxylate symporter